MAKPANVYLTNQQLLAQLRAAPVLVRPKRLPHLFDSIKFDKAMAYDYHGAKGVPTLYIVENSQLAPTIVAQHP